ncbi:MAG: hypothetical protein JRI45_06685 [Deltaproteobacteria bacterium]|nr:hypothetical protein [Deltaproteobacteria bacterium]
MDKIKNINKRLESMERRMKRYEKSITRMARKFSEVEADIFAITTTLNCKIDPSERDGYIDNVEESTRKLFFPDGDDSAITRYDRIIDRYYERKEEKEEEEEKKLETRPMFTEFLGLDFSKKSIQTQPIKKEGA